MASTYTDGLRLVKQAPGENEDIWGGILNNVLDQIDRAVAGVMAFGVDGAGNKVLADELSENHLFVLNGTLTGNVNVIVPPNERHYIFFNSTSGAFTLTVKTAAGTGVIVEQGQYDLLYCDATNVTRIPLVYETKTQTLTNKTLTDPVINGGTFNLDDPLPVASGGTGADSFTEFAVLLGGDPCSNVAGLGTDGQVLMSKGAGAAPEWSSPSGGPIPSGAKMIFCQASAPSGWTQDATLNDRVLRVVSGTGAGTGGSWTISGITAAGTALSTAQLPAHAHTAGSLSAVSAGNHTHTVDTGSETGAGTIDIRSTYEESPGTAPTSTAGAHTHTLSGSTDNAGSGSTHTHSLSADGTWRPQYVNVIVCSKD